MYENSAEDNICTAIIESNGITEMLNRIEYVSDVYDSDLALMDSYQAAVEQVKEIGTKPVSYTHLPAQHLMAILCDEHHDFPLG